MEITELILPIQGHVEAESCEDEKEKQN